MLNANQQSERLVKSYTATGNNITGVDNYYLELSGKRLEYFQRLLPGLTKVAVLYEDVVDAVRTLNREEADGIMLLCSLLLESITDAISPVALEKGFPVMGVSENQTLKGLLASYGMPYDRQGVQAARIVAKVLRGQSPAAIPVESPAQVEFIVNLETARKLHLNLDAQGLACATKFINGSGL